MASYSFANLDPDGARCRVTLGDVAANSARVHRRRHHLEAGASSFVVGALKVVLKLVSIARQKEAIHTFDMFAQEFILLLSITSFASQAPLTKRAFSNGPVITSNFPDPAFINVDGTYYAFATSNGAQNVQIATSPDFDSWTVTGGDALPTIPPWSTGNVWAPDVVQLVRAFRPNVKRKTDCI